MMRRSTAAFAALFLLVTACSGSDPDVTPAATGSEPVRAEPTADAEAPSDEELLDEYGALLAQAAVAGGDALERTLCITAGGEWDDDCAPSWAHALLDDAEEAPAGVEVAEPGVVVGGVGVPAEVVLGRALHLGGDCDGRLPQPDRSRPDPDPEPVVLQAAPELTRPAPEPAPAAAPAPEPARTPVTEPRPAPPAPAVEPDPAAGEHSAQELARKFGDAVWRVEATGCGGFGTGTAFAVDERTLVTNGHVVHTDMAPRLVARDGVTSIAGRVIGWSAEPDVAVIEVDEDLDTILTWEPTDRLEEGQQLVALGYPVPGTDFTVTRADILSFQTGGGHREAIRTSGALDKGNSGGPVLTLQGKVAGVVTRMTEGAFQLVPLSFTHDHLRSTIADLRDQDAAAEPSCSFPSPRW
jgi:hypothetical protein